MTSPCIYELLEEFLEGPQIHLQSFQGVPQISLQYLHLVFCVLLFLFQQLAFKKI